MVAAAVGLKRSRALWDEARRPGASFIATIRAILYELQPIRFSSIDWNRQRQNVFHFVTWFLETVPTIAKKVIPSATQLIRQLKFKHWKIIFSVLFYYAFVRIIHFYLEAGPIVMILTALIAIFTIGLGDNNNDNNGVSAYSVFNKNLQRLLGTVDAQELVHQHVGGIAVAAAPMPARDEHVDFVGLQQQQQQRQEDVIQNHNNINENNASRKSGKKTRRRNLEQRKELRRQRQAALDMGFGGGRDDDPQQVMAMQMLLEEQIAARNNDE